MRGATEPGVMPGDGSERKRNFGMRAWRVECALAVTLV